MDLTSPRATLSYDVPGLLFANRCTWAQIIADAAVLHGVAAEESLTAEGIQAVGGVGDPGARA